MFTVTERRTTLKPSAEEIGLAREGERIIHQHEERGNRPRIRVTTADDQAQVPLPDVALRLIEDAIHRIAQGQVVVLTMEDEKMTTQQAADLLNVSRPHLIQLLEAGELPFQKVGRYRRIRRTDVLAYKQKADVQAERAYAELVALGQEIGLNEDA